MICARSCASAEERCFLHRHEPPLILEIERPQARFAAWYELFPRSATESPERHGTFDDVIRRLPAIRDMGFDVLYLTPIHPIGHKNRKGKNNSLSGEPNDVGSPYAIGSSEGGHDAIHPELGTIDDFRAAARCSARDTASNWRSISPFNVRRTIRGSRSIPNGSIGGRTARVRYAENPPKKYEDIVNVDFYARNAIPGLWHALRDIVLFWVNEGVRIFRVDNPHTKPLPFWEWLIADVRSRHPDVIFLAEAFTRPKMMYRLGESRLLAVLHLFHVAQHQAGADRLFCRTDDHRSQRIFPPASVRQYARHQSVLSADTRAVPGFLIRAALAATLSGLWGMYSGFEICEAAALPGREEY